jgi:hypothetical protein
VFVVLLGLTLKFLEKFYEFGILHNRNIKLSHLSVSPQHVPLLFHGPCEPLWMISPEMIKRTAGIESYNLALSHSDFADNYLHLYLYLKNNRPPDNMLLYITPESLDERFNTFNSYRFAPYLRDSVVRAVVKENDPDYYRWSFIPFIKYAYYNRRFTFEAVQGYKHYFTGRTLPYYPDGFEPPAKRVWGNHHGTFAQLYTENTHFAVDTLRVKYLMKIIDLAHQKGIQLYLYESPVLKEAYLYQPNRNAVIDTISRIAVRANVPFIRFDRMKLGESRRYYLSTLSLNMQGLAIFNDSLGRYLKHCVLKK